MKSRTDATMVEIVTSAPVHALLPDLHLGVNTIGPIIDAMDTTTETAATGAATSTTSEARQLVGNHTNRLHSQTFRFKHLALAFQHSNIILHYHSRNPWRRGYRLRGVIRVNDVHLASMMVRRLTLEHVRGLESRHRTSAISYAAKKEAERLNSFTA
jgi:hypothetical protein